MSYRPIWCVGGIDLVSEDQQKLLLTRRSWGKLQEAYRQQHNLSNHNLSQGDIPSCPGWGVHIPSWIGGVIPHPVLARGYPRTGEQLPARIFMAFIKSCFNDSRNEQHVKWCMKQTKLTSEISCLAQLAEHCPNDPVLVSIPIGGNFGRIFLLFPVQRCVR